MLVKLTGDPGESCGEPAMERSLEGEAKFKEDVKKESEDVSKELGEPGPGEFRIAIRLATTLRSGS